MIVSTIFRATVAHILCICVVARIIDHSTPSSPSSREWRCNRPDNPGKVFSASKPVSRSADPNYINPVICINIEQVMAPITIIVVWVPVWVPVFIAIISPISIRTRSVWVSVDLTRWRNKDRNRVDLPSSRISLMDARTRRNLHLLMDARTRRNLHLYSA